MTDWPPELEIAPVSAPLAGVAHVPGSKSITNRLLILSALATPTGASSSESHLLGALRSEDTELMVAALTQLGVPIQTDWAQERLCVTAVPRSQWAEEGDFYCGNSGTTLRFLAATLALGRGRYRLDGSPRMRQRPIEDLLAALRQLGVSAWSEQGNDCPPVRIETSGLRGGRCCLHGDKSSQFASALLLAAPLADAPETIVELRPPVVSVPYLHLTLRCLRAAGAVVVDEQPLSSAGACWRIPGRQSLSPRSWSIEPDATAASYFLAAAAITGGRVEVPNLSTSSWQGDVGFAGLLEKMGCAVEADPLTVQGRALHGIDADLSDMSDTVMTLASVALFAAGPTRIRNVAHIRLKESDRLQALAAELRKTGAHVLELYDGLEIHPAPLHGARLETYNDHRLAMAFALIGLRVPGVVVVNPGCVAKTFPGYFAELTRLCRNR